MGTIFYSWQSDTPNKVNRNFLKYALEKAIKNINRSINLEESLRVDQDTKDIPGTPEIANTILKKIENCDVFIPDLTIVAKTKKRKQVSNPNVLLELGYAMKAIGTNRIIAIMNEAYGAAKDGLPFDLQHKRWPILYDLDNNASPETRIKQRGQLVAQIESGIRAILDTGINSIEHHETPPKACLALYFDYGERLAKWPGIRKVRQVFYDEGSHLYLRIIPTSAMPLLKERQIKNDIIYGIKIQPLRQDVGGGDSWERNKYGGLTFSYEELGDELLYTTSQVFNNREIWGIDATLLSNRVTFPRRKFEELFEKALKHYIDVSENLLQLKSPLIVEAGASGIKGYKIIGANDQRGRRAGIIYRNEIKSRHPLNDFTMEEMNKVLLAIYEDFYDAAGENRPPQFRGFPPGT